VVTSLTVTAFWDVTSCSLVQLQRIPPPNYLRLQVSQPQCLRVIGNHPRRTPNFPPAQLSKHPAHPRSHPPPYLQIFRPLPPQPPLRQHSTTVWRTRLPTRQQHTDCSNVNNEQLSSSSSSSRIEPFDPSRLPLAPTLLWSSNCSPSLWSVVV